MWLMARHGGDLPNPRHSFALNESEVTYSGIKFFHKLHYDIKKGNCKVLERKILEFLTVRSFTVWLFHETATLVQFSLSLMYEFYSH